MVKDGKSGFFEVVVEDLPDTTDRAGDRHFFPSLVWLIDKKRWIKMISENLKANIAIGFYHYLSIIL